MHESGQIGQLPVVVVVGGGGVGGGLQKIFFRPLGPHSGLKIGGRGSRAPPVDPAPVTEH